MKKLNSKAFSAVEALLIVVVIALLAGVGYYVYSQQQDKDNNNEIQQATPVTAPKTLAVADVVTYTLPNGWTEIECPGKDSLALAPEEAKDPGCAANQPNRVVSLTVMPSDELAYPATVAACEKAAEDLPDGTTQVSCTEVTVDEVTGVKQVQKTNEDSIRGKNTTLTSYSFKVDNSVITVSLEDEADETVDDVAVEVTALVESFNFK